jgi:AhpD family alkylhydroperoxidase
MSYHDHSDFRFIPRLMAAAPEEANAFVAFNKALGRGDGQIPRKYRELISIAVALTTQCPYCLENHTRFAKSEGATAAEIAEVVFIAAGLRAGAAVAHGFLALKLFGEER